MPDAEPAEEADRSAEEQERLNRQLTELLNELRVAMPGVQVLFAFLLAVPFQQRFASVSAFQRDVYYLTLVATTLSAHSKRRQRTRQAPHSLPPPPARTPRKLRGFPEKSENMTESRNVLDKRRCEDENSRL